MKPKLFWAFLFALPTLLALVYFFGLWQLEQYQFFVVLLGAVGTLFYQRWDRQLNFPNTKFASLAALTAFSTGLLAGLIWSPWLGYFSLAMCFTSLAATSYEKISNEGYEPLSQGSLFYLALSPWICLRVPLGFDDRFVQFLQRITAKLSSYILDLMAVPHQISGVIFELANGRLFVEEACSGVQSLFALLCVAFLLMSFFRRPLLLAPIYAAAGIFSAILLNIVRVTSIALAQEWYQYDLAHGLAHDVLGYTCLFLAIALLLSFDRLFQVIFYPISDDNNPLTQSRIPNPTKLLWNRMLAPSKFSKRSLEFSYWKSRLVSIAMIASIAACCLLQLSGVVQALWSDTDIASREKNSLPLWSPSEALFTTTDDLNVDGFEQSRDGKDISQAKFVDIWKLSDKSRRVNYRIAISQPYDHFHDLNACYYGTGWLPNKSEIVRDLGSNEIKIEDWPFNYSTWMNPSGSYAYLSYSAILEDGTPSPPPSDKLLDILRGRLTFRIDPTVTPKNHFMFQIWTTMDVPLSAEEELKLKRLHIELRQRVLDAYRQRNQSGSVKLPTPNSP